MIRTLAKGIALHDGRDPIVARQSDLDEAIAVLNLAWWWRQTAGDGRKTADRLEGALRGGAHFRG